MVLWNKLLKIAYALNSYPYLGHILSLIVEYNQHRLSHNITTKEAAQNLVAKHTTLVHSPTSESMKFHGNSITCQSPKRIPIQRELQHDLRRFRD